MALLLISADTLTFTLALDLFSDNSLMSSRRKSVMFLEIRFPISEQTVAQLKLYMLYVGQIILWAHVAQMKAL